MADRVAPGGAATIVLGSADSKEGYSQREEERMACVDTPDAAPRFTQAPGGDTSICLGGAEAVVTGTRGPVGGADGVVLGEDSARSMFARPESAVAAEAPKPSPRFTQEPGGTSSICLGGKGAVDDAHQGSSGARGPVGGAASIVLGSDSAAAVFTQRKEEREAAVGTPAAAPRFHQAPGGDASISLAAGRADAPARDVLRSPPGGAATVVLGCDDTHGILSQHQERRDASITTPDAQPRFSQAPGGSSTVCLGPLGIPPLPAMPVRGPVGGTTSICLGGDEGPAPLDGDTAAASRPVGGAASVVLGTCDTQAVFSERRDRREADVATPGPAPRFQQAPGGTSSVSLAGDGASDLQSLVVPPRGPVGGAASIVLGSDDCKEVFCLRQEQRGLPVETPDAPPRFTQPPGGIESAGAEMPASSPPRGPVGGATSIVLGSEGPPALLESPGSTAPRLRQSPGGNASICLNTEGIPDLPADQPAAVRGEVGGAATIVLGADDPKTALAEYEEQHRAAVDTPAAPSRFPQAPGGDSRVLLAGGAPEAVHVAGLRQAPGGAASLVLGGDYPNDIRARQQSANAFARGADQNCGNVLTERPTTRLHQAPGGDTTICLGSSVDTSATEKVQKVSANRFAKGANQNSGNVLTDRSTTRIRHAPGGASTLSLSGDYPDEAATPCRAVAKSSRKAMGVDLDQKGSQLHQDASTTGSGTVDHELGDDARVVLG